MEHDKETLDLITKYPTLKGPIETGVEVCSLSHSHRILSNPPLYESNTASQSHDHREAALLEFILSHQNIASFKSSPPTLLAAIDEFSYQHDFLISIGNHKANVITDLFQQQKPKVVIELGGYLGYSAILFAYLMKTNSPQAGGDVGELKVWSLEMNADFAVIARQLIQLAGLEDIVEVVVGPAEDSLRKLVSGGTVKSGEVNLVFLDHVEDLYVPDFKVCQELGLLKKGTMIIADNVVKPGAPEYRALVRGLTGVESDGVIGLITPGDFEVSLSLILRI